MSSWIFYPHNLYSDCGYGKRRGGQGIIVYAAGSFATFNSRQYKILIETRTRRMTEEKVKEDVLKTPKKYLSVKEFDALRADLSLAMCEIFNNNGR